jgi:hypothetical protein
VPAPALLLIQPCCWFFSTQKQTSNPQHQFTLHAGTGSHVQLQQVWEEMRSALQAWLAEGQLPGGLASLDKASYEQAVCTYAVLQEAASKGPEFLEQVRLV